MTLPCKTLRQNPNYSKSTWNFVASQTGVGWGVVLNTSILAHATGLYELTSDETKYDLTIKEINEVTAGTYECAGYIDDKLADVHHAFAMYMSKLLV